MPTNYTGNALATESPSPTPALGAIPILALPVDTDPRNSASIYQPFKTLADFEAFIQQKLNGIISNTLSVYGLAADGVGNQAVVAAAGQIAGSTTAISGASTSGTFVATAAKSGTTTPTTTVAKWTLAKENVPFAWVTVTGSTGVIYRAFNIAGVVRNATGVWTVTLTAAATAATDIVPCVTCIGTVPMLMSAQQLSTSTIKVFSCGAFGGTTPQDTDFSLVVYTGT